MACPLQTAGYDSVAAPIETIEYDGPKLILERFAFSCFFVFRLGPYLPSLDVSLEWFAQCKIPSEA